MRTEPPELRFETDGAQLFRGHLDERACADLETALSGVPENVAGVRISGSPALARHLAPATPIGDLAVARLGQSTRPVRAVLFDKTAARNWALGWHQDRTIAVRARIDAAGFGPWTRKHGLLHIEPPFEIIARMVTLRVHLDPVDASNAPLRIVPGSHRLDRLPKSTIDTVVAGLGAYECLADRGNIWLTPHRSTAPAPPIRPAAVVCYRLTFRRTRHPAHSNGLAFNSGFGAYCTISARNPHRTLTACTQRSARAGAIASPINAGDRDAPAAPPRLHPILHILFCAVALAAIWPSLRPAAWTIRFEGPAEHQMQRLAGLADLFRINAE